jgi:hypothetical protein
VSSSTIDELENRSRRGWLCAEVVNSGDQYAAFARWFPHPRGKQMEGSSESAS